MGLESVLELVKERAANADPLGASIKFDFGGNVLHLDGHGAENVVSTDDKEADCSVSVAQQDFADLLSGDLNPMTAFMTGKIKVDGNMGVAMKLQSLFG